MTPNKTAALPRAPREDRLRMSGHRYMGLCPSTLYRKRTIRRFPGGQVLPPRRQCLKTNGHLIRTHRPPPLIAFVDRERQLELPVLHETGRLDAMRNIEERCR